MIFGIFCLVLAVVSGCKNTMEAGLAIAGPNALEQMLDMARQQQTLPEVSEQSRKAEIAAQGSSVYRVGQAVESIGSMVMAGVLFIGGIGLLRDQAWALKLTKYWAYYAIPAAVVTVVLSVRYALPALPDGPTGPGGGMLNAAFMLIVLWAFPVLLLRQLPTAKVKDYLAWRSKQRAAATSMPSNDGTSQAATAAVPSGATNAPTSPLSSSSNTPKQSSSSASTPSRPAMRPIHNIWRDDPWNDPSSK